MKIEDYLNNPMGKGSSVVSTSDMKNILDAKYDKIKFNITLSSYLHGDRYLIFHIRIPSNSYKDVKYDVIIQIDLSSIQNEITLNKADALFFSNCPSFIFSYARAFKSRRIICDWLINRLDKKVFNLPSEVRNPYDIIGYEKSLYFACKYLLSGGRNSKSYHINNAQRIIDLSIISNKVRSQSAIMLSYTDAKNRADKEKEYEKRKAERAKERSSSTKEKSSSIGISKSKKVDSITKIKSAKTSTKKTNKIKKI